MNISHISANTLLIQFGDTIDEALLPRIAGLRQRIAQHLGDCVVELVPAYTTLLCEYDPWRVDAEQLQRRIRALAEEATDDPPELSARAVALPVWYDPQVGFDLPSLAEARGLTQQEVIARHCALHYRVYAVGFSPGFAFLGQVDPSLASPRHSSPRSVVPAGSVGIADRQTAVYPQTSPGGWQIIGRCPLPMFDANAPINQASRLQVGDQVRFFAVDRDEFLRLGGQL